MLDRLLALDRRWIFGVIALAMLIPLFTQPRLAVPATDPVKDFHREIDSLPEGSPVLVSFDFDAGSKPELLPMGEAVLRHCFRRKLRVVVLCLWQTGLAMTQATLDKIAQGEFKKQPGKDFVFLGWKSGNESVIIGMGQDLLSFFPQDNEKRTTAGMPALAGCKKLKNFGLVVALCAGYPGNKEWVQYGVAKYEIRLVLGVTGVIAPEVYPFLPTKQVLGLLSGMKGAAEYETLAKVEDTGVGGMAALSYAHFALIGLIVACNVLYLLSRRREARGRGR